MRARVPMVLAACMVVAAAVSWLRLAFTGTLFLQEIPLAQHELLMILLGLALGGASWLYLEATSEAVSNAVLARLAIAAVAIQVVAALAIPLTSNDAYSNLAYGQLERAGDNPFLVGPRALGGAWAAHVTPRWLDTPTVYGPIVQVADRASAAADSVGGALVIYKLELLLAALALVGLAYGYCRTLPDGRAAPAFLLVAWNPLIAWEVAAQAHNDGLMLVGLAAFVWAASRGTRRGDWVAVAALAFALYTKFAALPVAGLWLVYVARRSWLRAAAMAAVLAAVGVALYAPWWTSAHVLDSALDAMRGNPTRHTRSFLEMVWLPASVIGDGAALWVYRVGSAVCTALMLVVAGGAVAWVWRGGTVRHVFRASAVVFLLSGLICQPAFRAWYATWLVPLVMAEDDARWRRMYAVYFALSVFQYGFDLDPYTYLVVNGVPLVMLWRLWKDHRRSQTAASSVIS